MNLERAILRASDVRGPKSAARLYNDIEYELALGEVDDRLETAGENALVLLEDRFAGVRDAARRIEEPPSLSRRATLALHGSGRDTLRPRLPAHGNTHAGIVSPRAWRRPHVQLLVALPVVALSLIVIVHFLPYIVLTAIALGAVNACRVRR